MVVKIRLLHKPMTHSVLYSQSKCSHNHFTCIKEILNLLFSHLKIFVFMKDILQMVSSRALCESCDFSFAVKKISTDIVQYMVEGCQTGSEGEHATQLTSVFR